MINRPLLRVALLPLAVSGSCLCIIALPRPRSSSLAKDEGPKRLVGQVREI